MILSDILSDYQYVSSVLEPCNAYFSACDKLINNYFSSILDATSGFFKLASITEGNQRELISKLKETYDNSYFSITQIITLSFSFYVAMTKLEAYRFKSKPLQEDVLSFLEYGHDVMDSTNEIIISQLSGMKRNTLLPKLIVPLRKLMLSYHALLKYQGQFSGIDEILFEKIPYDDSDQYNRIELRSLKPTIDMDSFSQDIAYLSSFITQLELIMSSEGNSCKILTQKIESGSLRIVWGSITIELESISDIVKAISEGIRTFRLTALEKRLKEEQARELKLQNDEKELTIINSQIKNIAQITGLSADDPKDVERLQKLCLPLVRYINNNPIGMIGDYKYNLGNDLKLIEQFYDN